MNPTADMMEYELTYLKKFTKYSIVVNAFNRMGRGPPSDEVIAVTAEDGKAYFTFLTVRVTIDLNFFF